MSRSLIALACVGLASVPSALADITMKYPSSGVAAASSLDATSSFVSTTVLGWSEATGSEFQNFPDQYLQTENGGVVFQTVVPPMTRVTAGVSTEFLCNADYGDTCNVVVFFYSCHPCESARGNAADILIAQGFERTRCAPTFTTGVAGGIQHRMVGYVKTIGSRESETFTMLGDLDFALFMQSVGNGVTCSEFVESNCETSNLCVWKSGECRLASCLAAGPGPSSGCDDTTCARLELPA